MRGIENGVDMIEIDLQVTKDEKLIGLMFVFYFFFSYENQIRYSFFTTTPLFLLMPLHIFPKLIINSNS